MSPEKVSVFVYFSTTVNHNLFFSLPRLEKNLLKNFFSFSQFSIKCQTLWQFQYSNLHYALHFNLCVCEWVCNTEGGGGRGPAGGCVEPQPASQPIKQDGHVTRWEGRNHRDQIWRKFATWQNFKVWQKIRNYLVFGKILSLLMKDYYAVGHNFVALNCTCWTHHLVTLDRIQSQFQ